MSTSTAPPDAGAPSPTPALSFESLNLPEPVRAGIRAAGFTNCTPIQEKVLPLALAGRDVAGQAQTGTGKTAAFLLTVFTRLLAHPRPGRPASPRALVIAPTRELVVQIAEDAKLLGQATPFAIHAVFGGIDYKKQREQLESGVDVLIGTPGRLIDYWKQHVYDLKSVEILVIDEADRMFDMGFIKDLRFLLRRLPPVEERQSMLFSATLGFDVMELAYLFMNEAVRVSVSPEQVTAEKVEHLVYHVGLDEKARVLVGLLKRDPGARVLVFVNMKRSAERLEKLLAANGLSAAAVTGDVDQRRRLRLLADFKDGTLPILIATDVASRGLHIDGVTHVINYDLPFDAEDYVHRVGRTARAGASGKAISLACEDYVEGLEAIENYIGFKLPHDFPDETLLPRINHPPREPRRAGPGHREHGPREHRPREHGPRENGPREQAPREHAPREHAPREHAAARPRAPQAAAPAPAADGAPKKRRRRRRGGGGAKPAAPPA